MYSIRSDARSLGQGGNELFRLRVGEAVAHIGKALAQAGGFLPDVRIAQDAVGDQVRKVRKLLPAEAEAGHFVYAHAQRAGGSEALLVGRGLIVADDVVLLEPLRDLRASGVADADNDLMRLGVAHGRVARHVKPLGLQAGGEALRVLDHGPLVFVLEGVHLIRGHQLAEQRSEVMVGDAAGEGARFDRLPEAPFEVLRLVIHADHAALRAEEGLVRRAGSET